jgi:hypothetical protein
MYGVLNKINQIIRFSSLSLWERVGVREKIE